MKIGHTCWYKGTWRDTVDLNARFCLTSTGILYIVVDGVGMYSGARCFLQMDQPMAEDAAPPDMVLFRSTPRSIANFKFRFDGVQPL